MVLAESKNSVNLSPISKHSSSSSKRDLKSGASSQQQEIQNDFYKIQENYMKSLEYNYQLMYKLRDAKIFQVKRFIKLI